MVNIYVGLEQKPYHLHKALLCARSPFFNNAFNGSFAEASSSTLQMSYDEPAAFDMVVQWLYKGSIDPMMLNQGRTHNARNRNRVLLRTPENKLEGSTSASASASANASVGTNADPLLLYLQLFVLADKLQITTLQTCTLSTIRKGLHLADTYLLPAQINYIFNNTPPFSTLRKFAVDLVAFAICRMRSSVESFRSCFEESPDFAVGLVGAMQRGFPPFAQLADPRLAGAGESWGLGVGSGHDLGKICRGEVVMDTGNSMKANVSQIGSEEVAEWY